MTDDFTLQTAARLLTINQRAFDNVGVSKSLRPAPPIPGAGLTVALFLVAAVIAAFAM